MKKKYNLLYVAYGDPRLSKAHSIQIFFTLKNLSKFINVDVVYPFKRNVNKNFYYRSGIRIRLLPKSYFGGAIGVFIKNKKRVYILSIIDRIIYQFFVLIFLMVNNKRYEIVYTRDFITSFFINLYKYFFNFKVVYELHQIEYMFYVKNNILKNILKTIEINTILNSDSIITINNFMKKIIKKSICIPDAFEHTLFRNINKSICRDLLKLPRNKKIILISGRSISGLKFIIKTIYYFKMKNQKNTIFLIVGGNKHQLEFFHRISKKYNLNNIIITGPVKINKMPFYINSADFLLITYDKNIDAVYFKSPLKLFEYMATGVPIIAPNFISLKDVLTKKNSFLIKYDDVKSVYEIVNTVSSDKLKNISLRAKLDAKKYTYKRRALLIYHNILNLLKG